MVSGNIFTGLLENTEGVGFEQSKGDDITTGGKVQRDEGLASQIPDMSRQKEEEKGEFKGERRCGTIGDDMGKQEQDGDNDEERVMTTRVIDTAREKVRKEVLLVCLGDSKGFLHFNHVYLD